MPGRPPAGKWGDSRAPRGHTRCHETALRWRRRCPVVRANGPGCSTWSVPGLDGSPRAVLVHGEAGIGKTTLVRSVCEQVKREGAQVLWGQSLRFGAVEAMYHPLVLALEGWLGEADDAERASVVEAVPGAALILPSLGASPTEGPSTLMMVVDALLSRVVARGPTVLVVDDVQWADPATWDALSYLVAGFARQRLALVTTHRDEAAVSDGFQHWLGNVRRLPGTEELVLDAPRRGRHRRPDRRTARPTTAASAGGAGLRAGRGATRTSASYWCDAATSTPPSCPTTCPTSSARRCSTPGEGCRPPAREITRILAVGGRPTDLRTLAAIAAELGISQAGAVREAVDAGVVVLGGDGVWFRHPLLAGVLAETYLPGEATPVHAAWAAHLESVSTEGVDELRRLGDLASHHERAGDDLGGVRRPPPGRRPRREARRASRGRRPAGPGGRPVGGQVPTPPTRSATRGCSSAPALACDWVGRAHEGFRLLRAARDLVSAERDPLWASRLTARRGAQTPSTSARSRRSPLAEYRASRRALPGRARQPRARRGPGRLCRRPVVGRAD